MISKCYLQKDIAEALQRSASTISDEIRNNSVKGIYEPKKAHHKAYVRRKYAKYQGMKIVGNTPLKEFVDKYLYADQSPRAIAGRLKRREKRLPYVSKDSILRYINSIYGRRIERWRNKKRPRRRQRKKKGKALKDRIFIGKRPKIINARRRVGDTEADFIVSGKQGRGILLVVVCRKTRIVFIERILQVNIQYVHRALRRIKRRFPEITTMTTDNDILFQRHKALEGLLAVKIYFCDPYASWQKGSVENANKHIRKYIPKGSDVSNYSAYIIKKTERTLNNRIMECLDFRTPHEALEQHRKRKKRRSALVKNEDS